MKRVHEVRWKARLLALFWFFESEASQHEALTSHLHYMRKT